jgi:hypothetical protein
VGQPLTLVSQTQHLTGLKPNRDFFSLHKKMVILLGEIITAHALVARQVDLPTIVSVISCRHFHKNSFLRSSS